MRFHEVSELADDQQRRLFKTKVRMLLIPLENLPGLCGYKGRQSWTSVKNTFTREVAAKLKAGRIGRLLCCHKCITEMKLPIEGTCVSSLHEKLLEASVHQNLR